MRAIHRLAQAYCRDVRFGWALASEDAVVDAFGREAADAPFLAVVSDRHGVNATSKKRLAAAAAIFGDVLAGRAPRSPGGDVRSVVAAVAIAWAIVAFWVRVACARVRQGDGAKGD
jgi:hypothetical protein